LAEAPALVSAVVPAYNAEATLAETLRSVAAQTWPALEIIVVDDGSTDGTAAIAEALARTDPRLRLIRTANRGVSAARNEGISAARGRWVAPVDADDLWHPTKIEKQMEAAARRPSAPGFVYCFSTIIDARSRPSGYMPRYECHGRALCQHMVRNFVGNGSGLLLLREAALGVGGYDERLGQEEAIGSEDWLLQLKVARCWEVACVPEALVGYRVTGKGASTDKGRLYRSWRSIERTVREEGFEVPAEAVRWAGAARTFRYAESRALAGDWAGAALLVARALGLDPRGTGATLLFRIARTVRRRLRPERRPPHPAHFLDCDTRAEPVTEAYRVGWASRRLAALERSRLAWLASLDAAGTLW